jgi:hypothetical protein
MLKIQMLNPPARTGGVIRADVHLGQDGRPKGSGIVVFESPDDARNAIQQYNGYDWQGRVLEVREDRFAGSAIGGGGGFGRGGFRGGFGGGYGGRGGFGGGRGGFGGGRGGFGGGYGGQPGGFEAGGAASAPPNPFTDYATSGTERCEIIYVRNVILPPFASTCPCVCVLTHDSFRGQLATTTWLSFSLPSARSSKPRFSTSRVVARVALVLSDSTQPTLQRPRSPSSRATSMVDALSDSASSSTLRPALAMRWTPTICMVA